MTCHLPATAVLTLLLVTLAGYSTDDGAWSPAAETLRAGPLSDSGVRNLINRRFIPCVIDLLEDESLSDREATSLLEGEHAVQIDRSSGTITGQAVSLLDPKGKIRGRLSPLAPTGLFLDGLTGYLRNNKRYNALSPAERKLKSPLEQGRRYYVLNDEKLAKARLEKSKKAEARYILGQIARRKQDWQEMERHFEKVDDQTLDDDCRIERTYRLWSERKYSALRDALEGFPAGSNRFAEARYLKGLANYHMGRHEAALTAWEEMIKTMPEGPWVYRADWAHFSVTNGRKGAAEGGPGAFLSSAGPGTLLGRIGYVTPNPDLEEPGGR